MLIVIIGLSAFLGQATIDGDSVTLHGLVSQGAIKSTDNNYLARSKRGSLEFAEAAINLRASLGDTLSAGVQLFTRDLGPIGDYTARFDWFHLDWRPQDWFGVRAGRVRLPFGLYNTSSDYDPARVAVLLPQSIYPTESRDFLLSLTGTQVYGLHPIGPLGALDYTVFGGSIFIDASESTTPLTLGNPYTAGGRLFWETPLDGLRVGGSVLALQLNASIAAPVPVRVKLPALLWVASLEYVFDRVKLAAEYSRWAVETESTNEAVIPESESESERYYVLTAVEVTSWLQTGLYYSALFPRVDTREGSDRYQHDVAATLRFDINEHWLVKLEGHFMRGTAVLSSALNPVPVEERAEDWGLFLVKTTAFF